MKKMSKTNCFENFFDIVERNDNGVVRRRCQLIQTETFAPFETSFASSRLAKQFICLVNLLFLQSLVNVRFVLLISPIHVFKIKSSVHMMQKCCILISWL